MKNFLYFSLLALLTAGLSGCVTAGSEINAGRRDLLYGDPNVALVRFQNAAALNPNALYYSALPEGTLTYVGRAYYATGRFPEARETLERAAAQSRDDSLARLYLGLTLAREGDRSRGVADIESGLKGIYDWLNYIEYRHTYTYGIFWDTNKEIRRAIADQLAMIRGGGDTRRVIADGEWVGWRLEEEIEHARWGEREEMRRDSEGKQP
jgi:tetratricopeptide (TPR) repeat protein